MLAGNLFQCRYDKTDLPQHDSDVREYECASNSFDLSIYLWIGATTICTLLLYMLHRFRRGEESFLLPNLSLSEMWSARLPNMLLVFDANLRIINTLIYATLFCLVVLLPYYAIVTRYSGTHTYQYSYTLSAIYTSGVIPFTVTSLLLGVLMYMVWLLLNYSPEGRATVTKIFNVDK